MLIQLTDYGASIVASDPAPALDQFQVGSDYNYVPLPTDTAIHGTLQHPGIVSPPAVVNANVVRYSMYMDTSVGDFAWGEIGIMYQGQLFALIVSNSLNQKVKAGATIGNVVRIDAYLTVIGANYFMIVDQGDTASEFSMPSLSTVDQLPPTNMAKQNAYVISAASSAQSAFQAYTDRNALWSFDAYQFATSNQAVVTAADSQSVTISLADHDPMMDPVYFGQVILQFLTGADYSICRYVMSSVTSGSSVTLGFLTPLAIVPEVGDRIIVFTRMVNSALPPLPIATPSTLGGIKIGSGLIVTSDGTCSVDPASLGAVTSVNGKGPGVVTLTANDISGISTVGKTGLYSDLIGAPAPYSLPIASLTTLGGVKAPPSGNLTISGNGVIDFGFLPVKSVNGNFPDGSGNITITSTEIGLVDPQLIPSAADLNSYSITGLYYAADVSTLTNKPADATSTGTLEVIPLNTTGNGNSIQRLTTSSSTWWRRFVSGVWSAWVEIATNTPATTTSLGVVKIGSGLSVDGTGLLTLAPLPVASYTQLGLVQIAPNSGLTIDSNGILVANPPTMTVATYTQLGVVKIGANPASGLSIAADGTLINSAIYTLPIASSSTLGGVKVGSGLSIAGDGTLSTSGVVKTVNGVSPDGSGNVTVPSDTSKLNRVNGVAVGVQYAFTDLGNRTAASGMPVTVTAANVQAATFTSGSILWSTSGWPASGTYAEVQIELINAGLATHTFPTSMWFINPDGTRTNSFATYIGNQRPGATNFQSSGTDFMIMWSRDGGTTIYCKVL